MQTLSEIAYTTFLTLGVLACITGAIAVVLHLLPPADEPPSDTQDDFRASIERWGPTLEKRGRN